MDTKNAGNYQVEDFVTDESFANYHLCRNTTDFLFWESWLLKHPDKTAIVEEAKNILLQLFILIASKTFHVVLKVFW